MGTCRLTLMRHGKAEPIDAYAEDFERPLMHRGVIEAQEMATRLLRRNLIPDLLLVSPAERAWATAEIVATTCELEPKQIQCARELYLATAERVWRLLATRTGALKHIMICAHNPALSEIASRFGPTPQRRELHTAGIATALWRDAEWSRVEPESADQSDFDDPENAAEFWLQPSD